MTLAALVLTLVTLQRVGELVLTRRNTRRLVERGAVEVAPGHYPAIMAMHGLWLAALWGFGWSATVRPGRLALFCVLQVLRVWVIATLGPRWTTRIIVVPAGSLVRRGPYRWVSHPNYMVVAAEIAVLPLVFGLPWVALVFSILNAAVLVVRIRAETQALAGVRHAGANHRPWHARSRPSEPLSLPRPVACAVAAMKLISASRTAICMGSVVASSNISMLMTVSMIATRRMNSRMMPVTSGYLRPSRSISFGPNRRFRTHSSCSTTVVSQDVV